MNMNLIKDKLVSEFDSMDWKVCKFCVTEPELYIQQQLAIVRCPKCYSSARGFFSAPCIIS